MKRSEAVAKLEQILNKRLYQDYQFSTDEVSDLLKEIEDMGMQPPGYRELIGTGQPDEEGNEMTDWAWIQNWVPEE